MVSLFLSIAATVVKLLLKKLFIDELRTRGTYCSCIMVFRGYQIPLEQDDVPWLIVYYDWLGR